MTLKNYAAIDIGSNSVRLLIKGVNGESTSNSDRFIKVLFLRVPVRMGMDVFTEGKISKGKAKNLKSILRVFKTMMEIYDVVDYRACATSAVRDAKNGIKIIDKINNSLNMDICIIGEKEEAKIINDYHERFSENKADNFLFVEVGGGNTEISFISDGKDVFTNSYRIGTLRVLNEKVDESEIARLSSDLEKVSQSYSNIKIVGSGGNINKLYKLVTIKDEKEKSFTVSDLRKVYAKLKTMSMDTRMELFKLKEDRADVIVPAADIFLRIADAVKSNKVIVPRFGLSDCIINYIYENNNLKIRHNLKESTGEYEKEENIETEVE